MASLVSIYLRSNSFERVLVIRCVYPTTLFGKTLGYFEILLVEKEYLVIKEFLVGIGFKWREWEETKICR